MPVTTTLIIIILIFFGTGTVLMPDLILGLFTQKP